MQTPTAAENRTPRFSPADFSALIFAAALLFSFMLMPWMDVGVGGVNVGATGARFLLDEPVVDMESSAVESLMPENPEPLARITDEVADVVGFPDLVILGGLLALFASVWGVLSPKVQHITALAAALGGIMGVLYFISFFAANRYNGLDVIGYMGVGFWLSLFSSAGLMLQVILPRPIQETTPRIDFLRRTLWKNRVFILVTIVLIILPQAIGWQTNSSPFPMQRGSTFIPSGESAFWMSVLIEIFALSILVMSYNLMFGFTGVISLGHALFFGIGAYTIGVMVTFTDLSANTGFLLGVVITLLLTGIIGFFIGLVSLRLRGLYFAIFTLAIAEGGWIFIKNWSLTSKDDGFSVANLPAWIDPVESRLNLYYLGLIAFIAVFLLIQKLVNSPTGTVLKAIRENEQRARAIGYATLRYKLIAITTASMIAGVAGILHGILNKQNLGPTLFSVNYTVDALLMTIIGGAGTLTGPVLGAAGLHTADTLFRDAQTTILGFSIGDNWLLITGFIFVLVVLVFPYGIAGTWAQVQVWLRRRGQEPPYSTEVQLQLAEGERQPSAQAMIERTVSGDKASTTTGSRGQTDSPSIPGQAPGD